MLLKASVRNVEELWTSSHKIALKLSDFLREMQHFEKLKQLMERRQKPGADKNLVLNSPEYILLQKKHDDRVTNYVHETTTEVADYIRQCQDNSQKIKGVRKHQSKMAARFGQLLVSKHDTTSDANIMTERNFTLNKTMIADVCSL